jgi:hypothetical protein
MNNTRAATMPREDRRRAPNEIKPSQNEGRRLNATTSTRMGQSDYGTAGLATCALDRVAIGIIVEARLTLKRSTPSPS